MTLFASERNGHSEYGTSPFDAVADPMSVEKLLDGVELEFASCISFQSAHSNGSETWSRYGH